MLTLADIQEFKRIYERDYGEVISDSDAGRLANALVRFYLAVVRSPEESPRVRT